jgi:hypothetical protein
LVQPVESQRLYKDGALLADARKLAELKVENDDVIGLAYLGEDGKWEELDITPLDAEKAEGAAYYG